MGVLLSFVFACILFCLAGVLCYALGWILCWLASAVFGGDMSSLSRDLYVPTSGSLLSSWSEWEATEAWYEADAVQLEYPCRDGAMVTQEEFEVWIDAHLLAVPEQWRRSAHVRDWPSREEIKATGNDPDKNMLLACWSHGTSAMIIYMGPIVTGSETKKRAREWLGEIIVHELAHAVGMNHADMERALAS